MTNTERLLSALCEFGTMQRATLRLVLGWNDGELRGALACATNVSLVWEHAGYVGILDVDALRADAREEEDDG